MPKKNGPQSTTVPDHSLLDALKKDVLVLHHSHGLIMLKGGTEWEDMDLEEIAFLNGLRTPDIPCLTKVSGPEAKSEIRHLLAIGVDALLSPMIESEYALQKFVTTARELSQRCEQEPILAINIETTCGHANLDRITTSPYFADLDMVVIGRWDLANSMGTQDVDDKHVGALTAEIVDRVRAKGKSVSIGGFVNPSTAGSIQQTYRADRMNTVHALFDISQSPNISTSVRMALNFELNFYEALKRLFPHRSEFYDQRIGLTLAKLATEG
jgi:4-hydroxy-2-oxoheptanedioate aldolase